jgi:AraC-like DNA-binding protein
MKPSSSLYQDRDASYRADRCAPLVEAVAGGQTTLKALARAGYPGQPLRRGELPGVLSLGFWDASNPQNWGLPLHRNEGIELTFLQRGKLAFSVHSRHYTLAPGDLTITRPWQPHSVGNPHIAPGRLHWLILDVAVRRPHDRWIWPDWLILTAKDRKQLTTLLSHNENPVWHADNPIADSFERIADTLQRQNAEIPVSRLVIHINHLLLSITELLRQRRIELQSRLNTSQRTVELYLEQLHSDPNLLAHPWTTAEMARQCGLGTTHFNSLCKKITNSTPAKFLCSARVKLAQNLLRNTDQSITHIAYACGFSSSQYFATVFQEILRCSPRQFRSRRRNSRGNQV